MVSNWTSCSNSSRASNIAVDGQNLIARRKPGFRRRRSRHSLQDDHAAWQHADDGPEAFVLAVLHLLQLLELARIEKDRVRIKRAQHARNRALIERRSASHRIGRLLIHGDEYIQHFLELARELLAGIVSSAARAASEQKNECEKRHGYLL